MRTLSGQRRRSSSTSAPEEFSQVDETGTQPPPEHARGHPRCALARDWQATLGPADYVGQAEVTSRWPAGNGSMTPLAAQQLHH
jgi:hypothetical protein